MKKILLITVILMFGLCANAQRDAFFEWNDANNDMYRDFDDSWEFVLPTAHSLEYDGDAPLGSGLLVLTALGAGYAVARRRHSSASFRA